MTPTTRLIAILVAALFTGCATLPPINTASKRPEVTIATANRELVKARLIDACSTSGYTLVQESPSLIAFSKPMTGSDGFMYQLAMGNAYSSQPQQIVRFTVTSLGGKTQVYGSINTSMQNAFGRSDGMDLSTARPGHEVQLVLEIIKAEIEGTKKQDLEALKQKYFQLYKRQA
jgi:hypothetical protein